MSVFYSFRIKEIFRGKKKLRLLLLTIGSRTEQGLEISKRPLCNYRCRGTWAMWMELIWLKGWEKLRPLVNKIDLTVSYTYNAGNFVTS